MNSVDTYRTRSFLQSAMFGISVISFECTSLQEVIKNIFRKKCAKGIRNIVIKTSFIVRNWPTRIYNTIQYNTIQYNTIQYNTIKFISTFIHGLFSEKVHQGG